MREADYQAKLKTKITRRLPEATVLVMDGNYIQGFPDLLILYQDTWAALEVKVSESAPKQPNQEWYISTLGEHVFSSFIYPENEREVLNALQQALRA